MSVELSATIQHWVMTVLVWVGFGTLAALLAKAVMPGKDPGGAVATVCMGIAGCVIGSGTVMYFLPDQRIEPISILGFVVAAGGSFVILALYRLLSGRFFREGETRQMGRFFGRGGRRRGVTVHTD
jgi:uncharacterized membrane protein YeaQ/YmgE (transglycosylase-associated protein family)